LFFVVYLSVWTENTYNEVFYSRNKKRKLLLIHSNVYFKNINMAQLGYSKNTRNVCM